jgi:hypothetical protein
MNVMHFRLSLAKTYSSNFSTLRLETITPEKENDDED